MDPVGAADGAGRGGEAARGHRTVTTGSIHLVRFHCKDSMVLMFYAMVRQSHGGQDVGTPLGPPILVSYN